MSKKFRWFLLGSCAFVVVMGARDTFVMLADGPRARSKAPELESRARPAVDRKQPLAPDQVRRFSIDGELARGEARTSQ